MWKELKWEDISKLKNSYDENGKLDLARSNDPYLLIWTRMGSQFLAIKTSPL